MSLILQLLAILHPCASRVLQPVHSIDWLGMLHRKLIPVSDTYDGDKFFVVKEGVKMATPLLLALAVIEISDVAFAVDSIPAVCSLASPLQPADKPPASPRWLCVLC